MTKQDQKDIIGFISEFKEVYQWYVVCNKSLYPKVEKIIVAKRNDLSTVSFTTPAEVREDILWHKWGVHL